MFDSHNSSDCRVVIDLREGEGDLDIDHIDVEVNEEIEFEVRGRIENLDDDVLEALIGDVITPAEIHFCTDDTD